MLRFRNLKCAHSRTHMYAKKSSELVTEGCDVSSEEEEEEEEREKNGLRMNDAKDGARETPAVFKRDAYGKQTKT